ncbi:MAG: cell division topological specificity factor MinE, partial [Candidatus Xenobia bacterium]
DRASVCPELLDSLRHEMIQLLSRYMVIDEVAMSVALEKREGAVALAANIPVINIRRTEPSATPAGPVAVAEAPPAVEPADEVRAGGPPDDEAAKLAARRARILKRKAMRRRRSSQEE